MVSVGATSESAVLAEVLAGEGLGMSAAAREFGRLGRSGRLNPVTVSRWWRTGLLNAQGERVKLEAVVLGNRPLTSRAAVARFLARLQGTSEPTPSQQAAPQSSEPTKTQKARAAEVQQARAELERLGV